MSGIEFSFTLFRATFCEAFRDQLSDGRHAARCQERPGARSGAHWTVGGWGGVVGGYARGAESETAPVGFSSAEAATPPAWAPAPEGNLLRRFCDGGRWKMPGNFSLSQHARLAFRSDDGAEAERGDFQRELQRVTGPNTTAYLLTTRCQVSAQTPGFVINFFLDASRSFWMHFFNFWCWLGLSAFRFQSLWPSASVGSTALRGRAKLCPATQTRDAGLEIGKKRKKEKKKCSFAAGFSPT
jgi:hypothetical protein